MRLKTLRPVRNRSIIMPEGKAMPMFPGFSRKTIEKNTEEMIAAGHEPKQAYAASMNKARESARKAGKHIEAKK